MILSLFSNGRLIYILDSSNSSKLASLEATEPVSEPVTQMTVELTNIQYCLLSMDRAEKS